MRKTKLVLIDAEGRDNGKLFQITEMPAVQAEKWATRAFLALAHAGVEVPEDYVKMGLVGLAVWTLESAQGLAWLELEPLLDEMMSCVKIVRDRNRPDLAMDVMPLSDFEEVSTLMTMRREIFELHTNFSLAGLMSLLTSTPARGNPPDSSTTSTLPETSAASSPPA